ACGELLRLIREQEARTPRSRLSSAESTPGVAASRQIEPAKLGRFVKGELDWIVMKALAKERDRRYETANGFARDIERFLNHEPVLAGPPSASYRLRKFVERNRVVLATAAGAAGGLLVRAAAAARRAAPGPAGGAGGSRCPGRCRGRETGEGERAGTRSRDQGGAGVCRGQGFWRGPAKGPGGGPGLRCETGRCDQSRPAVRGKRLHRSAAD